MPTELAQSFRTELSAVQAALLVIPAGPADTPWRYGGWTRKEIVGHMLDSAANNRQRFVRTSIEGSYSGPTYSQKDWLAAHGYADQPWATLLDWWKVEHEILASVVDRIAEESFAANCVVAGEKPVSLRFLIEDYLDHQKGHLAQLTAPASPA